MLCIHRSKDANIEEHYIICRPSPPRQSGFKGLLLFLALANEAATTLAAAAAVAVKEDCSQLVTSGAGTSPHVPA